MTSLQLKRFVFCLLFSLLSFGLQAQFIKASIGVNGLTCSQCSRSVEMQLRKLVFIKEVQMDLEHTEGIIFFKENKKVDIAAIAKAIKDAGFSVRFIKADIDAGQLSISEQGCFKIGTEVYQITNDFDEKRVMGTITLDFIGKGYSARKQQSGTNRHKKGACVSGGKKYDVLLTGKI